MRNRLLWVHYHVRSAQRPSGHWSMASSVDHKGVLANMMSTILTIIIMGMLLQGVMAVIDSVLDTVNVNSMLKSIPVVGSNLNLILSLIHI